MKYERIRPKKGYSWRAHTHMPALGRLGDAAERSRLRANLTSVEGGQKLNSRVVLSWGDICYKLKTLGPYNFLHRLSTSITA